MRKHTTYKPKKFLILNTKKKVLIEFSSRDEPSKIMAKNFNIHREILYSWNKIITGEPVAKKTSRTKQKLKDEICLLKKEHARLKLENKILKK